MNIAVVDDIEFDRRLIVEYINKFFACNPKAATLSPSIVTYQNGEEFLADFSEHRFHFVILDIYRNGMNIARKICDIDKDCKIIICTTSKDNILDGYQIHAVGYLIKPISDNYISLYNAIEYVISCLNLDEAKLDVKIKTGNQSVRLKEICYIDCLKRTAIIHFKKFNLPIGNKYKEIQTLLLRDSRFLECYRNIILNMDYITSFLENDILLQTNETIPISRRKKKQVLDTYMKYVLSKDGYLYDE